MRSPSAAFGRNSDEVHRPAHYRELLQRAGWWYEGVVLPNPYRAKVARVCYDFKLSQR